MIIQCSAIRQESHVVPRERSAAGEGTVSLDTQDSRPVYCSWTEADWIWQQENVAHIHNIYQVSPAVKVDLRHAYFNIDQAASA